MKQIKIKGVICLVTLSILFTALSVSIPGTFCDTRLVRISSARQYVLGAALYAAISKNGEIDTYTFKVTTFSNVEIHTQGRTDTFGTLKDSAGSVIVQDDDGFTEKNFSLRAQLSPGVYYLEVRDYYPNKVGKYTLQSSVSKASRDTVGNTVAEASAVSLNTQTDTGIDYPGDMDYFAFTLDQKGTLEISTLGDTDTYGMLLDSNGAELAQDDDNGDLKNFSITKILAPGTYYLKVSDYYPDKTGAYSLKSIFTAIQEDHYGKDIASATLISPDSKTEGFIGEGGDNDYFKFILDERKNVRIHTTGKTDTQGTLYDENGKILSTQDDASNTDKNFMISQILDPGIYYIRVKDFYDSASGAYTLFLQTDNAGVEKTEYLLESGDANPCAFAYYSGRYAYVGCNVSPARIVKYDIQTMKRVSSLDLPAGENRDQTRVAALIAVDADTVIHASFTNPCVFTKIDGNTMTITGTLQGIVEPVNDKYIRGLAFDGRYVYAATYSTPSKIIKIDPVTMTRVDAVTFDNPRISCCFSITICGDYLVGVCEEVEDQGSVIFRVRLDDLHQTPEIIQVPGINQYHSVCTDGRYVYAATDTDPVNVVKIDPQATPMQCLAVFSAEKGVEIGNFTMTYDGTSVVVGTWNFKEMADHLIKLDTDTLTRKDTMDCPSKFPSDLVYIAPYFYTSSDHPTGIVDRFRFQS